MSLTREQRAARAWASQGMPVAMIECMTEVQLDSLADLVDESGKQVENFRERFLEAYHAYYDAQKALVDDPEIVEEKNHVAKRNTPRASDGGGRDDDLHQNEVSGIVKVDL